MTKQASTIVLLIICMFYTAAAQPVRHPTLWKAYVSVGYSGALSKDVTEFYNGLVESYRSAGVAVPTQIPFGRTAVVSAGISLSRTEVIWAGLCAGYSYSPAYSSYKDYAGTLKISGSTNSVDLSFRVKTTLFRVADFPLMLSIQPGLAHVTTSIQQELRLSDPAGKPLDWKWSASAWGPFLQAALGTTVPVGMFGLTLEGGYRFSWNKVDNRDIETSTGELKTHEPWDIGPAGALVMLSCEMRL